MFPQVNISKLQSGFFDEYHYRLHRATSRIPVTTMGKDPFLEFPVRLLGYGYAFNEATRFIYDIESMLYTMANLYIITHIMVTAIHASDAREGAIQCIDILIFHKVATIYLPCILADASRRFIARHISKLTTNQSLRRLVRVFTIVALLIMYSTHLDSGINKVLDASIRKKLKKAL